MPTAASVEGDIELRLGVAGNEVRRVSVHSTRPLAACAVLHGRPVAESLRLRRRLGHGTGSGAAGRPPAAFVGRGGTGTLLAGRCRLAKTRGKKSGCGGPGPAAHFAGGDGIAWKAAMPVGAEVIVEEDGGA